MTSNMLVFPFRAISRTIFDQFHSSGKLLRGSFKFRRQDSLTSRESSSVKMALTCIICKKRHSNQVMCYCAECDVALCPTCDSVVRTHICTWRSVSLSLLGYVWDNACRVLRTEKRVSEKQSLTEKQIVTVCVCMCVKEKEQSERKKQK